MPTIPAALLKQIYQRGSLHNTATGWAFTMRNHLAPAQLVGMGLICDGVEVPPAAIQVVPPGWSEPLAATAITAEVPLLFTVGANTLVEVAGPPLSPGAHSLAIQAVTREIGTVTIPVQDTVAT
jgi:hydroxymethylglutaryl-CoA reductase (NADPH)